MTKTTMVDVECGNCDGKGKLDWCSHIERGRCFACKGTGKLQMEASKLAAMKATEARRNVCADFDDLVLAEIDGDESGAAVLAGKIARALHALADSKLALEIINGWNRSDLSGVYGHEGGPRTVRRCVRLVIDAGKVAA